MSFQLGTNSVCLGITSTGRAQIWFCDICQGALNWLFHISQPQFSQLQNLKRTVDSSTICCCVLQCRRGGSMIKSSPSEHENPSSSPSTKWVNAGHLHWVPMKRRQLDGQFSWNGKLQPANSMLSEDSVSKTKKQQQKQWLREILVTF